jgi:hypothetical protein
LEYWMSLNIKTITIVLALITLTSCVSYNKELGFQDTLGENSSYIAMRLYQKRTFLDLFDRSFHCVFVNVETGKKYKIRSNRDENLIVIEVPPGRYRLSNITKGLFSPDYNSSWFSLLSGVKLSDSMRKSFVLEDNQMVYLGNYNIKPIYFLYKGLKAYMLKYYYDFNRFFFDVKGYQNYEDLTFIGLEN